MERIKLEFKVPNNVTFEYNKSVVEIKPYLDTPTEIVLINKYVEDYFFKPEKLIEKSEYAYLDAEYNQFNYIIQANTNIDVDSLPSDVYSNTSFVELILSRIINYKEFKEKQERVVRDIKEQIAISNSAKAAVAEIMTNFSGIIDSMADITPEQIESAKKAGIDLMKELEKNSILTDSIKKE